MLYIHTTAACVATNKVAFSVVDKDKNFTKAVSTGMGSYFPGRLPVPLPQIPTRPQMTWDGDWFGFVAHGS